MRPVPVPAGTAPPLDAESTGTGRRPATGVARARVAAGVAVAVTGLDAALAASGSPRARRLRRVTKPAVLPAVTAAVRAAGGRPSPALGAALAGSWAGDVALLSGSDAGFLGGVGGFAAAHVAYLAALRDPALRRTAPAGGAETAAAVAFGAVGVAAGAVLWRRLGSPAERRLRGPVLGYAALVTGMGAAATRAGLRTGDRVLVAGGALFVLSDGLVAAARFGGRRRPAVDAAVMLTYAAAQALLATALTRHRPDPAPPLTRPRP